MNAETKNALFSKKMIGSFIMLVFLFALLLIALFIVFNSSLGWFSQSTEGATATGMLVTVSDTPDYTLLIERTDEFDAVDPLNGNAARYPGIAGLKSMLDYSNTGDPAYNSSYRYSLTDLSTSDYERLAYELINENVSGREDSDDNYDYHFLRPGSCGTLTFYLKPRGSNAVTAEFNLTVCGFNRLYGEITEDNNAEIIDLLSGHILFFETRTGNSINTYKYDDLIVDHTFTYTTEGKTPVTLRGETCYKIELYWEWPINYGSIRSNTAANENDTTQKYPWVLHEFVKNEPECFFAGVDNVDFTQIDSLSPEDVEKLIDGYNDGDQEIGDYASFLIAFVSPLNS
ncbi:MAG: hypothetical protein IJU52_04265 [Clostridia bacterium]|nr:hypothetical protein [Clostridia bacterium]